MSYFTSIGNFGLFNSSTSTDSASGSGPSAPHSQVQNPVTSRQVMPPSTQMIGVSGTGPVGGPTHIPRNRIPDAIPQTSRNDRKLADYGGSAMGLSMGNSGAGYGTYMPFQESGISRKEAHQMPQSGQQGGVSDSYARQFDPTFCTPGGGGGGSGSGSDRKVDQAQYINPGLDIRKGYNSAPSVPLKSNYDNYMTTPVSSCIHPDTSSRDISGRMFEHNANYMYNAERNLGLGIPMNSNMGYDRNGEVGQRRRCAGPSATVQSGIQGDPGNQYFFQNFETLNKIAENEEQINRFMDRNPVNTRRDEVEKERLSDRKQFMSSQGGMMATRPGTLSEITPQQTRRNK